MLNKEQNKSPLQYARKFKRLNSLSIGVIKTFFF